MYKPSKKHLAYIILVLIFGGSCYVIGVSSNGQNPTIDQDLGIFNFPWFNASVGINAPEYVLNDIDVTDIFAYPQQTCSYLIWRDGSTYYAKNGNTGEILFSGTNATTLFSSISSVVYADGGGHIHIKKGEYLLEGTLATGPMWNLNAPNLLITGEGAGTVLKAMDDTSDIGDGVAVLRINAPNVVIAYLTVDGNKANQNTWDNQNDGYNIQGTQNAHHLTLFNVWSVNGTGDGVEPYGHYTAILNSRFIDNWEHSVHIHGNYSRIIGNYMEGEVNNGQIDFYASNPIGHSIIANNIIKDGAQEGIKIEADANNHIYDVQVLGNYIYNHTSKSAIVITRGHDIIIKDNIIVNAHRGIMLECGINLDILDNHIKNATIGIYFNNCNFTRIEGNTLVGTQSKGITCSTADPAFDTWIIQNNLIIDASSGGDRSNEAIVLSAGDNSGDALLINNNKVVMTDGANRVSYELKLQNMGSVTNIRITDNYFDAGGWTPVIPSGAFVEGNYGYTTENDGMQICADNENIIHGLVGTPTTIQLTPLNATYDGVPVIANVDWTGVDGTNINVALYWVNGTAISDDIILVSWRTEYEP